MAALIGTGQAFKDVAQQGLINAAERQQTINEERKAIDRAEKAESLNTAATGAGIGFAAGGPVGALAGAALGYAFGEIL